MNTTTNTAKQTAATVHAARVAWDARYVALSATLRDLTRSIRYSEDNAAERAACAEVERKIVALGSRP